jgi:hypothetical protein
LKVDSPDSSHARRKNTQENTQKNTERQEIPMARQRRNTRDGDAFIRESDQVSGAHDDLAEYLAEGFLLSAVSGESSEEDTRDQVVEEELGGPFIEASSVQEFGATRFSDGDDTGEASPLPTALGPLAIAGPDELDDEVLNEALDRALGNGADGVRFDVDDVDETPEPDAEPPSRIEPVVPGVRAGKSRMTSL